MLKIENENLVISSRLLPWSACRSTAPASMRGGRRGWSQIHSKICTRGRGYVPNYI